MERPKADLLFEVSWEVCNKVGGIWTVVTSKIDEFKKRYDDRYFCIGPYFPDKVKGEFIESAHPEELDSVCSELESKGIILHYGEWLHGKGVKTFLIDFKPLIHRSDDFKSELWEKFQIDSLHAPFEFSEPLVWSWAVGMFLELYGKIYPNKKIVAQFHEWLAGGGLLYLKDRSNIKTVFTTHATVLGRALVNKGVDIYSKTDDGKLLLDSIDSNKAAREHNVLSKHLLEKACAHNAHVFTTVSEITSIETKHILDKIPDILLPNGVNIDEFPSREDAALQHKLFKQKFYRFLTYYFFPHYELDFDKTLIYFTACRYEMHNKGIDVLIDALGKLNKKLKEKGVDKTIVYFLFVPTAIRGIKPHIIENRTFFNDIFDSVEDNKEQIMDKVLTTIVAGKNLHHTEIIPEEIDRELKKKVLRFRRSEVSAPLCTHDLQDENDAILSKAVANGLTNSVSDKVKLIFYPIYLTGADGLLNLNYYEAIQGAHLGIFPSGYEPYGYTPLECASLSVASLTSDVSGFGQFIWKYKENDKKGIYILNRMDKSYDNIVEDLTKILFEFSSFKKKRRIESKLEARRLAEKADWSILVDNYIAAHDMALKKD